MDRVTKDRESAGRRLDQPTAGLQPCLGIGGGKDQPEFIAAQPGNRRAGRGIAAQRIVDPDQQFVARTVADGGRAPPQWAGLKFFNVYGPNEYHKGDMASVISKLHPRIVAGEPARLFKSHRPDYEDGGQSRDFIWVGDCVSVMLWLADTPKVCGLFNVGSGAARSFKDLALATFAAAGIEPNVEYFDMPESLRDRYQYFTQARMERLREAGYRTRLTSLEDGVKAYVQGFLGAADPYL